MLGMFEPQDRAKVRIEPTRGSKSPAKEMVLNCSERRELGALCIQEMQESWLVGYSDSPKSLKNNNWFTITDFVTTFTK